MAIDSLEGLFGGVGTWLGGNGIRERSCVIEEETGRLEDWEVGRGSSDGLEAAVRFN
jgi:hypothetical protein